MRLESPAASTTAAICGAFTAAVPSRGAGRVGISMSSPPAPMSMMSCAETSMSARVRASTQSKPLTLGERAQEGTPITGTASSLPSINRFPGSTGIPRCTTLPPADTSPAGSTSPRSTIAEAPNMRMGLCPDRVSLRAAPAHRRHRMIDDLRVAELAAQLFEPHPHGLTALGDERAFGLRQPGDDETRPLRCELLEADQRPVADDCQSLGNDLSAARRTE